MVIAERGNKIKHIAEADINKYVEQGYTIKGEDGKVIRETVPVDVQALKTAFIQQSSEIKSLKAEIETLKAENTALKAEAEKKKVETVKAVEDTAEVTEETETAPKRGTRKKSADAE